MCMSSDDAIYSPYLKQGNAKDAFVKKVDKTASVVDKSVARNELLKSSATPEYLYDRNRVVHLESKGLLHDYKADIILDNSIDATLMSDGMKLQLASEMMEKESSLIKNSENVHSLTGDVAEGVKGKIKAIPKETLKGVTKGAALGAIRGTQALVGNTYGEESMEAMEVLSGKQLKEGVETVKGVKAKVDVPFAAVGKVARAPRRVGEAYATILEHSATRQLKRADKKIKNYAGNKEALAKAHRQLGRAQAKLNRAKMIKAKKRPFAWLFDGQGKDFLLKIAGAFLPFFLIMGLVVILLISVAGNEATNKKNGDGYGNLEGNCLVICQFLREKGLPDVAIAAICGNIFGESGYRPDAIEYDENGTTLEGRGICQWSFGRRENLFNFAKSKGKEWTDIQVQLEFLWMELTTSYDLEGLKAQTDVEKATIFFHDDFERSAAGCGQNRIDEAKRVYEQLQSGGGGTVVDGPLDEKQQAIIDACKQVGFQGAGRCATWVSHVYAFAGCGYPYGQQGPPGSVGNWYDRYCHSSNKSDLKPGMIICVPSNNQGDDGRTYGHVGIYVGNNKVMDNTTYIRTIDLDDWINENNIYYTPKWGWAY